MKGLIRGTVCVVDHDDAWTEEAEACIALLKEILSSDMVDAQHVGSTAIHSIPAKPIVDIAVGVKDFRDMLKHNTELSDKGICYRKQEHGDQLLYLIGDFEKDIITHHIHVMVFGSEAWNNYLNFRDYLNCHEEDAKDYAQLKTALAKQFPENRAEYTAGKQNFIESILQKASAWRRETLHNVGEGTVMNHIYYEDQNLKIRDLKPEDAEIFTREEIAQGWNASIEKYMLRLRDQESGKSINLVAEYRGQPAGYINVYPNATGGAFANLGYPEIVDFGVLEKYRNHGIGSKLMDIAEQVAGKYSDTVYLGVGLHSGYGSAQRMYIKRGYLPDGSGVWYGNKPCPAYSETVNDDDLNLYLSKKLK